MFRIGVMIACAMGAVAGVQAGPLNPVRLSVSLDRRSYLENEPVFVEWALTNVGQTALRMPNLDAGLHLRYRVADPNGQTRIGSPLQGSLGEPMVTVLGAGETYRGWVNLLDYVHIEGTGRSALSAVFDTRTFGGQAGVWSSEVASGSVFLTITTPTGEDAEAAGLVQEAISKEGEGGHAFVYYVHSDLCERILADTQSARFGAVSSFYLGMRWLREYERNRNRETLSEAVEALRASVRKGSSDYLRGLARYNLLRSMVGDGNGISPKIKSEAAGIIRDHPNTYAAMKAAEILAKLTGQ